MKIFLVLACVLAIGASLEFQKNVKLTMAKILPDCISEVGATEADLAEITARKAPTTVAGKCLSSCLLKKFGLQDENGSPSTEGLLKILEPLEAEDPNLYTKLIEVGIKCGPKVTAMNLTDHCDIALQIATCGMLESKAVGIDDPFMF